MPDTRFIIDRNAERRACRKAAQDTAAYMMEDARELLANGLDHLRIAERCRLSEAYRQDFAKGLRDVLCNLWAAHDKVLDDEGIVPLAALDLSELDALIDRSAQREAA